MPTPDRDRSRRDILIASGSCAMAGIIGIGGTSAQEKKPGDVPVEGPPPWRAAIESITGATKVAESRVTLDIPEIAENGNVIPFNISVDSPMTEASFVRAVRLFSTANPLPLIATFRFSTESGKAAVSSRFRLAKTQDVVALAEMNDGTFFMAKRSVKVTIGGCGG